MEYSRLLKIVGCCFLLLIMLSCQDNIELPTSVQPLSEAKNSNATTARVGSIPALINISTWLTSHPVVAARVQWQFQPGTNAYQVLDSDKKSWAIWSSTQKADLAAAFAESYHWYFSHYGTAVDAVPVIQSSIEAISPNGYSRIYIPVDAAWNLYIRWVAHSLFIETYHIVPWSVTTYDTESLDLLFDSSRFMRMVGSSSFILGFDMSSHYYQPNRKSLIGQTTISAPIFTYKFLKANNILPTWGIYVPSNAKTVVIKHLIDWASQNMTHFYNADSQQNSMDHWGEQAPAFVKVVNGTTAPYAPYFSHWTAGCSGTSSFFAHALRAANIPVQYVAVCDHILPVFRTEGLFMDHGDNPYNLNYKLLGSSPDVLLLNTGTFTTLFGENYYSDLNIMNGEEIGSACDNVGYTTQNLDL